MLAGAVLMGNFGRFINRGKIIIYIIIQGAGVFLLLITVFASLIYRSIPYEIKSKL